MPTAHPWTTRIWLEYRASNLTRAHRDVLLTLRTFQGIGGACWPSHETLADRAVCCVRTVQRALQQARELGLVSWVERRVKAAWRWLRTSNAYRLHVPDNAVLPGLRPARVAPCTTGQPARGIESLGRKKVLQAMMLEAARSPDLLEMRRVAFEMSQRRYVLGFGNGYPLAL